MTVPLLLIFSWMVPQLLRAGEEESNFCVSHKVA
jgi:hypothetical protein